ncbi:MAG: hypothetical protein ACOYWZ_00055 [Bacillota bacterium]
MEEIEISWDNTKVKVKIDKLNFGDRNDAYRKAMKVTMLGNQPKADLDIYSLQEFFVLKGLKEAPFSINIDNIRKLDVPDAEKMYSIISRLTGITESEKGFLPISPEVSQ